MIKSKLRYYESLSVFLFQWKVFHSELSRLQGVRFPRALIGEHQDGSFRGEADGRQQAERG